MVSAINDSTYLCTSDGHVMRGAHDVGFKNWGYDNANAASEVSKVDCLQRLEGKDENFGQNLVRLQGHERTKTKNRNWKCHGVFGE